jgi:hypothetical protein
MAWGLTLHSLDFKAISGHATGVTAVLPTLFYLVAQAHGARMRAGAIAAGLVLGCLMAALLVALDEHSVAEALAGWLVGATVSLAAIRLGGGQRPFKIRPQSVLCSMLVFLSTAWLMHGVPYGYVMARTAVLIAGKSSPLQGCTAVEASIK